MGLDFTLYRVNKLDGKSYNIVEELYLSNASAMLVVNWLYRNHHKEIVDKHEECDNYTVIDSDLLETLYRQLNFVLYERNDVLALFYFPTKYTIAEWVNSCQMFGDAYYDRLEQLKSEIGTVLDTLHKNGVDGYQEYVYNISW